MQPAVGRRSMEVFEDPLLEILESPHLAVGDRNYPPQYGYSLGRYTASPRDVERMRRAIGAAPRAEPAKYDILFNAILRTWDVVKWVPMAEPMGFQGAHGLTGRVVEEPMDVYSINARERDPSSLGELDWLYLRSHCVTTRGSRAIEEEVFDANAAVRGDAERARQDAEYDLAGYMGGLLKRLNAETGFGDLSPEEMARRTRTDVAEWTPDEESN